MDISRYNEDRSDTTLETAMLHSDHCPTQCRLVKSPLRWAFGLPLIVTLILVLAATPSTLFADEIHRPQDLHFFETRIRPLLVERCYECHSQDLQEGGLRLDNRQSILMGGDRGEAAVPGRAAKSLMIAATEYTLDDLAMPPEGKLSAEQIRDLRTWIDAGMPWPTDETDEAVEEIGQRQQEHWAFRAIKKPELPNVKNQTWVRNAIDVFVLSRLESADLEPAPSADDNTLRRRIHFDLLGLPPSDQDFKEQANETSIDRFIDRLLANPAYGERWGRHWLDVARYADTRGYVDGGQTEFAFAYTYRDYVVRAFNQDLRFDQFITDQLAADQQSLDENNRWRLAGLGFLTVGRRFNHDYHDMIDDQIDVISRGLQGMTVSCARCHDHKYDDIPTADYYSLYGILASSYEPQHSELPLLKESEDPKHLNELRKRASNYLQELNKLHRQIQHELRGYAGDYLLYIVQESAQHREGSQNPLKTERTILRGPSAYGYGGIRRWRDYLMKVKESDPVFGPWKALDLCEQDQFADVLQQQLEKPRLNALIRKRLETDRPESMRQLAQSYGILLEEVYSAWNARLKETPDQLDFFDPSQEQVRQVLYGPDAPATMTAFESIDCYHLDEHTHMRNVAGKVEELSIKNGAAASRAMVLEQRTAPYEPVVFLRGRPNRLGPNVTRKVPSILNQGSVSEASASTRGHTRLDLARSITASQNPLTARVLVNRIWHWHFGKPLVETVSDFGVRSNSPSHPKLLDYLAAWLIENDWSLKKLHRLILDSATYRQSSLTRSPAAELDPENRLLWRYNARRLEWEVIRDSLLHVSGRLEQHIGGRAERLDPDDPTSRRRTVYTHLNRQDLPEFARVFDFPAPDFTSPQRPISTVPQQQLFFLNSDFVLAQAKALGQEFATMEKITPRQRFIRLHERILGEPPRLSDEEINLWVSRFDPEKRSEVEWWALTAHAFMQSSQFVFIE